MLHKSICHWPQNISFLLWSNRDSKHVFPSVSGVALKHPSQRCLWVWHAFEGAEARCAKASETKKMSPKTQSAQFFSNSRNWTYSETRKARLHGCLIGEHRHSVIHPQQEGTSMRLEYIPTFIRLVLRKQRTPHLPTKEELHSHGYRLWKQNCLIQMVVVVFPILYHE